MKPVTPRRQRRRVPRQRRALITVEAILDAVVRILKREGVTAVTTNRIAEVAGVSVGSVYQYFPDKRAVFVALHKRHVEEIDRVLERALVRHANSSLEEFVSAMVIAMTEAHAADPQLYELLFSEVPHRGGDTRDFPTRFHGAFRAALSSRTRELKPRRRLDQTAFVVTHMLESLSHGAVLRRPAGVSFADAKAETVRSILAYLRA
ncbi:MAG TPA: TetR/AcrR family transcriptional regulator [Steroidobacteraceae bacterium]|jgi:AcrR family transcriptional regulator